MPNKYKTTFTIEQSVHWHWVAKSHTGAETASSPAYKNWHNAMRALKRHILTLKLTNFILPTKPLRKAYTFKSNANQN